MKKKHQAKKSGKSIEITSHEFPHHERNHLWYLGIGVLLVAFLMLTIYFNDYLLMAVVLAAAIAIFRLANLKPTQKNISLSDEAVKWGKETHSYNDFRAFWVGTHADEYHVHLERLNFRAAITFSIDEDQLEDVLAILATHLPFHWHRNSSLADRFNRFLKL